MSRFPARGFGRRCLTSVVSYRRRASVPCTPLHISSWKEPQKNESYGCFRLRNPFCRAYTSKLNGFEQEDETLNNNWTDLYEADLSRSAKVAKYLQQLSPEQQAAVDVQGKVVRVIAGPGSGKTRVMIARAAKLIADGVCPGNIMMLTFTNKAANEAKDRLKKVLGSSFDNVDKLTSGTFHSVCCRILRRHVNRLNDGRNSSFTVLDEEDSEKVVLGILEDHYCMPILETDSKETQHAKKIQNKNMMKELREKAESIANKIAFFKERFKTVYDLKGDYFQDRALGRDFTFKKDFIWAFDNYQDKLKKSNAFDFGDLIGCTVTLILSFSSVKEELRNRYKHIFVDEMQDTNKPQYEFLRLLIQDTDKENQRLYENKLFVVGDPNQAIYAFRGAQMQNLMESMDRDFDGLIETLHLLDNYRSVPEIVRYAESHLEHFVPDAPYLEMKVKKETPECKAVSVLPCNSAEDEAHNVAQLVQQISYHSGINLNEIAIFYRTHSLGIPFEKVFLLKKIPYCLVKGTSLTKKAEIKDLFAYLRFVANPSDILAFERIVNKPSRKLGQKSLQNLKKWAEAQQMKYPDFLVADLIDHWRTNFNLAGSSVIPELEIPKEAKITKAARSGIQDLRRYFYEIRKAAALGTVSDALRCFFYDLGFRRYISRKYKDDEKTLAKVLEYIDAIENTIQSFDYDDEDGLDAFQVFVQEILLSNSGTVGDDKNGVCLMTMHAAKGLEFKVVFIVGCEQGTIPYWRNANREDESRLMFVSITRAMEQLYLSWASDRSKYGQFQKKEPSEFLEILNQFNRS